MSSLLNSDPGILKSYGNSLLAKKDYKGAIDAYTKFITELDLDVGNDKRQQDKNKFHFSYFTNTFKKNLQSYYTGGIVSYKPKLHRLSAKSSK